MKVFEPYFCLNASWNCCGLNDVNWGSYCCCCWGVNGKVDGDDDGCWVCDVSDVWGCFWLLLKGLITCWWPFVANIFEALLNYCLGCYFYCCCCWCANILVFFTSPNIFFLFVVVLVIVGVDVAVEEDCIYYCFVLFDIVFFVVNEDYCCCWLNGFAAGSGNGVVVYDCLAYIPIGEFLLAWLNMLPKIGLLGGFYLDCCYLSFYFNVFYYFYFPSLWLLYVTLPNPNSPNIGNLSSLSELFF